MLCKITAREIEILKPQSRPVMWRLLKVLACALCGSAVLACCKTTLGLKLRDLFYRTLKKFWNQAKLAQVSVSDGFPGSPVNASHFSTSGESGGTSTFQQPVQSCGRDTGGLNRGRQFKELLWRKKLAGLDDVKVIIEVKECGRFFSLSAIRLSRQGCRPTPSAVFSAS